MGLGKSLIKMAVGGAIVKGIVKETKKTPEERADEKIVHSKTKISKVIDVSPDKIKDIYKYLKNDAFDDWKRIENKCEKNKTIS